MNNLPTLWGLARIIGDPAPCEDAAANELLADPGLQPAAREVLNAAFLIAGYLDGPAESGTLTAHARTLLAGPGSKEFADTIMRSVDGRRVRIAPEDARALDLSYERLFSLTRAEQADQFQVPIALLAVRL